MRFQVGESVKLVVSRDETGLKLVGQQGVVIAVGPYPEGDSVPHPWRKDLRVRFGRDADYLVRFPGQPNPAGPADWQLQKLNPPEEPVAMVRHRSAK